MRALAPAARADLEDIVSRDLDSIRSALAGVVISEPVFAICLHYTPESAELLDPPAVYVGTDSDRRRALAAGGPVEVFSAIWNPMEYTGAEVVPESSLREDAAFMALEERLVPALHLAGVDEPRRLVLNQVARRLSEAPVIEPVSDDYVAFVMDHGFHERLLENLRTAAPPAVAARLRQRGLLPDSIDELRQAT